MMDKIGNDALDFSGSNVTVSNSKFYNVYDKAISMWSFCCWLKKFWAKK